MHGRRYRHRPIKLLGAASKKQKRIFGLGPLSQTGIADRGYARKSGNGFAFKSPRAFAPNFFYFLAAAAQQSFARQRRRVAPPL
jgi:hypothetical protein